ncbi:MAG: methyltransferase domain-containing protein, partial [Thermoplasmatales archaeon]
MRYEAQENALSLYNLRVGARYRWVRERVIPPVLDVGCADDPIFEGSPLVYRCDIDVWDHPNFVQCDAEQLPYKSKSFNTVVISEILEHVNNPEAVVAEAVRVARKRVLITTPKESDWDATAHPHEKVEQSVYAKYGSYEKWVEQEQYGIYPKLRKKVPDSLIPHSFHVREWDDDSISKLLNGYTASQEMLSSSGFVWYCIVIQ